MVDVWMAQDPETERVLMQAREPGDEDFPRGRRGAGWAVRQAQVSPDTWAALLTGELSPLAQDQLHRDLWAAADDQPGEAQP